MINIERLNKAVKDSGLKKSFIAEEMGWSINGTTRKLDGRSDFKTDEVVRICEVLGIDDPEEKIEIFLNTKSI